MKLVLKNLRVQNRNRAILVTQVCLTKIVGFPSRSHHYQSDNITVKLLTNLKITKFSSKVRSMVVSWSFRMGKSLWACTNNLNLIKIYNKLMSINFSF